MLLKLFMLKTQTAYWYEIMAGAVRAGSVHYAEVLMQFSKEESAHAKLLLGGMDSSGFSVREAQSDAIAVCPGLPDDEEENAPAWCAARLLDMERKLVAVYEKMSDEGIIGDLTPPALLAAVAKNHIEKLKIIADRLEAETAGKRADPRIWHCLNCGYTSSPSENAPEDCPLCHSEPVFSHEQQNED